MTGHHDTILVHTNGGRCTMWAKYHDGGFKIQLDEPHHPTSDDTANFTTYKDFHRSVGHVRMNQNTAQRLYTDEHLVPKEPPHWHCHDCEMAKSVSHKPTTIVDERARKPFDVIHTDLSGKFTAPSLAKSNYFLPFLQW